MQHIYSIDPQNNWDVDPSGFLRISTRVLSAGVMAYSREELGSAVPPDITDDIIFLLVGQDTLAEPRAIRSLEGMPITADSHTWQEAGDNSTQVGSIAGTPLVNGPYLVADMLITDPTAAAKIMSRELVDLSAAYDMELVWTNGIYDGEAYHGVQTKLRYNHTALLPAGTGRAGRDVRVLNHKPEVPTMSHETTLVTLRKGVTVRVANEDVAKVQNAIEDAEKDGEDKSAKASNASVDDLSSQLKAALEAQSQASATVDELRQLIQSLQDQLDAANNPDNVADQADQMAQEKDDATQVLNAKTLPDDLKKLHGHKLRVAVLQKVRAMNKMPELTADQVKDESGVKARFQTLVEMKVRPANNSVPGADVVTTGRAQNSNQSHAQSRLSTLYKKESK